MLEEICAEIRNYFTYRGDIFINDYTITNGVISPFIDLKDCKYFRIIGSRKNNGVHKVDDTLEDEGKFHGSIWLMSPPKEFLSLVSEIEAWHAKNGSVDSAAMSPFSSESFGGYSYMKSTGYGSSGNGASGASGTSWITAYSDRLKQYRRMRVI